MLTETMTIPTLAQAAPAGAWVPLVAALVAGLVLWLLGTKVLRASFALLGGAAGGFVGMVMLPLTGLPDIALGSMTIGPQVAGMVVGALVGLAVAAALFKFIVTVGSGIVFAAAGVLGALIFLHFNPGAVDAIDPSGPDAVEQITQGGDDADGSVLDDLREQTDAMRDAVVDQARDLAGDAAIDRAGDAGDALLTDEQAETVKEQFRTAAERSKAFLGEIGRVASDEWQRRSARERVVLLGSGVAGFVFGLLAGVVFTKRATAVITALFGSAVWLAAGVALMRASGVGESSLDFAPTTWAVVWGGVAVIGLALQIGVIGRSHDDDDGDKDDDD